MHVCCPAGGGEWILSGGWEPVGRVVAELIMSSTCTRFFLYGGKKPRLGPEWSVVTTLTNQLIPRRIHGAVRFER